MIGWVEATKPNLIYHICWVDFSLWLNGLMNKSCNNLFFQKSTQPTNFDSYVFITDNYI